MSAIKVGAAEVFNFDCHGRKWHMTAFAAMHHLGRDWGTTDNGRFWRWIARPSLTQATSGSPLFDSLVGTSEHARGNSRPSALAVIVQLGPWLPRHPTVCYRPRRSRVHLGNVVLTAPSCMQGGSRKRGLEESHVEVRVSRFSVGISCHRNSAEYSAGSACHAARCEGESQGGQGGGDGQSEGREGHGNGRGERSQGESQGRQGGGDGQGEGREGQGNGRGERSQGESQGR